MSRTIRILYIDDNLLDRELVRDGLTKEHSGFELTEAASRSDFETALVKGGFDLVLSDFNILGFEGLQVLEAVHAKDARMPVIIVTGTGSEEIAVEALKRGAADYVIKTPKHIQHLPHTIHAVLEKKNLEKQRAYAEEVLWVSEAKYRRIVETAQEGIWIIDAESKTTFVNQKMAELLGYSVESMMGKPLFEFMDEDGQAIAAANVERHRQNIAEQHDFKFQRKDGSDLWTIIETSPILDQGGQYAGALAMVTDITERKRAEDEIRRLKEFDENLINNMSEGIAVQDTDGHFTYVNPATTAITGYLPDELVGSHWTKFFHADQQGIIKETDNRRLAGEASQYEIDFLHKSGKRINMLVSGSPLFENERFNGTMAVFTDITERKRAEAALTRSEQALRTLFENMPIGLYRTSAEGLILDANPALVKMFGYKDREAILAKNIIDFYVDPAYDEKFKNEIEKSNNLSNFVAEYRRLDGTTFWTEDYSHAVRNETGVVLFYEGSLIDITERKQAEKKIRRQIKYLTALQDIDRTIASAFDMHPSLDALISKAVSLLTVDAAAVLLTDSTMSTLEFAAGDGFRTNAVKTSNVKLSESYAGRAAMKKVMVKIPNLKDEADNLFLTGFFEGEDFVSYYSVPLIVKDKVIGVFEVFQRSLIKRDQEWLDFLNALAGQAAIAISNAQLFDNLQDSNTELIRSYDATIEGWSRAMDLRDKETEGHTLRVTEMTMRLASLLQISDADQVQIHRGALLHDIGKLGVPDAILLKPGKLSDEEWVIMRQHPTHAYEMLSSVEYLRPALDIPYCHHEKWDGTGYPRGLRGEQIPLMARIFAIVDVWDALRSDRPYRAGWSEEKVIDYIRAEAGKHFDPEVAKVFLNLVTEK